MLRQTRVLWMCCGCLAWAGAAGMPSLLGAQGHDGAGSAHAPNHLLIKFNPAARALVAGLGRDAAFARLNTRLELPRGAAVEEPRVSRLLRERRQLAPGRGRPNAAEDDAIDWNRFHYLRLPPGLTVEEALARLQDHPLLEYAEPDGVGSGGDLLPNDTEFFRQWHHRNTATPGADIATPLAWEITTGSSAVIVAVLDTGLAPGLPEFAGRAVAGQDFVNDDADPADDHGHGTAVAGTIAANANNSFMGTGVDWACRVMPIKVLDENNNGFYSDWAQGLDWAVANGAKVVNLSAGGSANSATLTQSINAAIAAGVIFVTITHNDSSGVIRYPGRLAQAITVGATTSSDRRSSFSNWGPEIDLVAPGSGIYTVNRNNTFGTWSGTSFAAPLVSGVCALMAGLRPDLTQDEASLLLTLGADDQLGDPNDTAGFDVYYGWGRMNAHRTLILTATNQPALTLAVTDDRDPAPAGCPIVYRLNLDNNSLNPAASVRVTNELPSNVVLLDVRASQGTHTVAGGRVVFDLGALPPRGAVSMSVVARSSALGILTNRASFAAAGVMFDASAHRVSETTLVVADLNPPGLVSAAARPDGRIVAMTFSEPLDAAIASDPAAYSLVDGLTNAVPILGASLGTQAGEVLLEAPLLSSIGPFTVTVLQAADCSGNPLPGPVSLPVVLPEFLLVPAGSVWRYLDDGSDQGVVWRDLNFVDGAWPSGLAELGYGDGDEATVVGYGPDPNAKHMTTYFRRVFEVPDASLLTGVKARLVRDDGAVVYLNGVELFRSNMPAGAVTHLTPASSAVGGDEETMFFDWDVPAGALASGTNVLAVEVHQSDGASSDLGFDFALGATLREHVVPPVFVSHPRSQSVVQGGTARFAVEVAGSPPFGYRWRRASVTVVPFELGTPELILTNVQSTDAGSYTVVVTNRATSIGVLSRPAVLTVLPDGDGDGMPDAWETAHGFNPADPSDGGGDEDIDGMTNREEYEAGTDPRDAGSVLRIAGIEWAGGSASMWFEAVSNRSYGVLHRAAAGTGAWFRLLEVAPRLTNGVERVTIPGPAAGPRFYRLTTP